MRKTVAYRFAGDCNGCKRKIVHQRIINPDVDNKHEWVRCAECESVTRLPKQREV